MLPVCLALAGLWAACGSHARSTGDSGVGGQTSASAGGAAAAGTRNSGGKSTSSPGGARSTGGTTTDTTTAQAGANDAGSSNSDPNSLGAYPFTPSTVTRGGTMTFTNVGAAGWWPRRLDKPAGDPACDYKDGTDTWGAHCCQEQYATTSTHLAPFDQEMTLILKAIHVKQLAVYQTDALAAPYRRVTAWDRRSGTGDNLWFTQQGDGSVNFTGALTGNDCVGYLSQTPNVTCADYYCPKDPGVLHHGYTGSKLVVFLGSMNFDDSGVKKCDGSDGPGAPGPWVAFVASELIRDGGRKWNGLCNCYSKTGSVGDGCGEINVFEVVMDNNDYSNREFASTGVRSFQAGHVGGAVCQSSCQRDAFPNDVEVVDACAKKAYDKGPVLEAGGDTDGCPVWRRPDGDRYFFILLDQDTRVIQVGVVHPANIPAALSPLLPELPSALPRAAVDAIVSLRLPQ